MGLVDQALANDVAFVVFAGDLYDGTWRDVGTALFFHQQVARLTQAGIPIVVLYRNHDAATELRRIPDHPLIHTFGHRKPATIRLKDANVALHGQSFRQPAVTDNLAEAYPEPIAGAVNIGVLHTALEGNALHASYAPCTLAQLCSKGYDYWALGHVHEHAVLSDAPHVVYAGNLQGRKVNEPGAKGAVLVTVDDDRWQVERTLVDVLRWDTACIDLALADSIEDVAVLARPVMERLVAAAPEDRSLALRIRLTGATGIHGQLWGAESKVREDLLVVAAQFGDHVYLEKVRNETRAPAALGASTDVESVLDDLRGYFAQAAADPDFQALVKEDFDAFLSRCPNEVREEVAAIKAFRDGRLDELLADVIPVLDARVREGD